jgi:hypothetical protein
MRSSAYSHSHYYHFQSLFQSLLFLLFVLLLPSPLYSSIVPYGNIGDPPLFILDVTLSQNQYECIYFDGVGQPSDIFIQLYFEQFNEIHSQASDFLFILSPLINSSSSSSSSSSCVMQGGYNLFPSLCEYLNHWNKSWSQEINLLVEDNLYPPSYVQSNDAWKFCVGNGWAGAQEFVRYQALVVMFGISYGGIWDEASITLSPTIAPTIAPTIRPTTPIDWKENLTYPTYHSQEILSNCNEIPVMIQFHVTLDSHKESCVSFFGSGSLTSLQITLNYTLHSSSIIQPQDIYQGPSDLAITLTNTQQLSNSNKNKIQIGGHEYLDDSIQGTILSWPQIFQNLDLTYSSSSEIEILIPTDPQYDLGSSQKEGEGEGEGKETIAHYEMCLVNTYASHSSSLPVTYQAHISLPNIQSRCDGILETSFPTLSPTSSSSLPPLSPSSVIGHSSSPTDDDSVILTVTDLYLQTETRVCVELILGGALTSIHSRFNFHGNHLNWVSDIILSIEDQQEEEGSPSVSPICYQVEGQTASFHLEECKYLATWPNEFNQVANGFYEAILDLQKPLAFGSYSSRKVMNSPPPPVLFSPFTSTT